MHNDTKICISFVKAVDEKHGINFRCPKGKQTYVEFHFSGLACPTSQFLNGQKGPAHRLGPLSSPALVNQSEGIWKVVAGK